MDNAMNNTNRAEQIEERMRNLQERFNAWQAIATDGLPAREIARLNRRVDDIVAEDRAPLHYREHVAEVQKALQSAIDDGALIQRLYEEIFLRATL